MKINLRMLSLLFLFYGSTCSAICQALTTVTGTINFGDVVVQRDVAIGTTLASTSVAATNIQLASCKNNGTQYETMSYLGATGTSISNVYATNIPGVGIRGIAWNAYPYLSPASSQYFNVSIGLYDNDFHKYELVKTGAIQSGTLTAGEVSRVTYDSGVGLINSILSTKITSLSCSISTPNLTFPIGNVLVSNFGTSVGTIPAGAQNIQNLGLNCDAGANINVILQGTQNPDVSTDSILALTGQGSADVAKGVGVQLLYNGSPLKLNNQIVLKQSTGGQETFPITARYYQTKTAVTTGKANASATLNLTYQ
ncbi:TPA: fimbrial protein [Enterobacter cloacae]